MYLALHFMQYMKSEASVLLEWLPINVHSDARCSEHTFLVNVVRHFLLIFFVWKWICVHLYGELSTLLPKANRYELQQHQPLSRDQIVDSELFSLSLSPSLYLSLTFDPVYTVLNTAYRNEILYALCKYSMFYFSILIFLLLYIISKINFVSLSIEHI